MRHFLQILSLAILSIAVVGCSETESVVVRQLQLSSNGVVFDAAGGQSCVTVAPYPESEEWQVESDNLHEWADYSVEGNLLYVTAEANTEESSRTCWLELVSPTSAFEPYRITISQESAFDDYYFTSSAAEEYVFDSEGGVFSFDVVTNCAWSLSTDADWLSLVQDTEQGKASIVAQPNSSEEQLRGEVILKWGEREQVISVTQQTRAENPYLQLVGKWEIVASKWFYSPNGSLNNLDYAPNASDYYLIFDIEQGEYGKSLYMRNFLYPGTSLEVRYDSQTGGIIIPFGWSVYAYEVFLYITCVGTSSFSYASLEVAAEPSEDKMLLELDMPTVPGFQYVGFGLWCYSDDGGKIAFGSRSMPTLFPMGDIVFKKSEI